MSGRVGNRKRLLMLGPTTGWHAGQLREAAKRMGHRLDIAGYETLRARIDGHNRVANLACQCGTLTNYDAILTRTMPAASMERITFRLAMLHTIADALTERHIALVNPPRGLEWAIDKFASITRLAALGLPVPATRFVQSRGEAIEAFDALGGDCVVKPLFGGEGRGVMRVSDPQLAWTTFATLDQLDTVLQVQKFIAPGGSDTRLLVVGEQVFGVRRSNPLSFRTNVAAGGVTEAWKVDETLAETARQVVRAFDLVVASVDIIDHSGGQPIFLEVNAIPGWKGTQTVIGESIAEAILTTAASESAKVMQ